jgi:hypothetical protein
MRTTRSSRRARAFDRIECAASSTHPARTSAELSRGYTAEKAARLRLCRRPVALGSAVSATRSSTS